MRSDLQFHASAVSSRSMLRGSAAATTAASYSRIPGANDVIRTAPIGCGGRGRGVAITFLKNRDVRLTALCDSIAEIQILPL